MFTLSPLVPLPPAQGKGEEKGRGAYAPLEHPVVMGSPHWQHSELVFEKKGLIPHLHRLFTGYQPSFYFDPLS